MKTILTILLIAVLAAEGAAVLRLRSLVNGWEKDVEDGDKALTDGEVRTVERLGGRWPCWASPPSSSISCVSCSSTCSP